MSITDPAELFASLADDEMPWQDRARCQETDPEAFFPEQGVSTRPAKRVCVACEVKAECLEYALETSQEFGVWGGMSRGERTRLKRQQRERKAA